MIGVTNNKGTVLMGELIMLLETKGSFTRNGGFSVKKNTTNHSIHNVGGGLCGDNDIANTFIIGNSVKSKANSKEPHNKKWMLQGKHNTYDFTLIFCYVIAPLLR